MELSPEVVKQIVLFAIAEDVGTGDINAALIPARAHARARIITRSDGVFCGRPWVDETARQVDPEIAIAWRVDDGDSLAVGQEILALTGPARSLLTAERTMINFMQLLSGTATAARRYVDAIAGTKAVVLDTRKTIPGLRMAQKYAVAKGGAVNHRMGLFDAYLIKENHIAAAGSITEAVDAAREREPDKRLEVEVENQMGLDEAIDAGADMVLLDNYSVEEIRAAVLATGGRVKLEASGNITFENIAEIARTGVDFISIGALTKRVDPLDLSMRFIE